MRKSFLKTNAVILSALMLIMATPFRAGSISNAQERANNCKKSSWSRGKKIAARIAVVGTLAAAVAYAGWSDCFTDSKGNGYGAAENPGTLPGLQRAHTYSYPIVIANPFPFESDNHWQFYAQVLQIQHFYERNNTHYISIKKISPHSNCYEVCYIADRNVFTLHTPISAEILKNILQPNNINLENENIYQGNKNIFLEILQIIKEGFDQEEAQRQSQKNPKKDFSESSHLEKEQNYSHPVIISYDPNHPNNNPEFDARVLALERFYKNKHIPYIHIIKSRTRVFLGGRGTSFYVDLYNISYTDINGTEKHDRATFSILYGILGDKINLADENTYARIYDLDKNTFESIAAYAGSQEKRSLKLKDLEEAISKNESDEKIRSLASKINFFEGYATKKEAQKIYHALALKYHPDKAAMNKQTATVIFQSIRSNFEGLPD